MRPCALSRKGGRVWAWIILHEGPAAQGGVPALDLGEGPPARIWRRVPRARVPCLDLGEGPQGEGPRPGSGGGSPGRGSSAWIWARVPDPGSGRGSPAPDLGEAAVGASAPLTTGRARPLLPAPRVLSAKRHRRGGAAPLPAPRRVSGRAAPPGAAVLQPRAPRLPTGHSASSLGPQDTPTRLSLTLCP